MSDDSYFPSSPSSIYSLGLDYEQSQHKQEIRNKREAEYSPEERAAMAEQRRLKRVKLGFESPNYKREDSTSPITLAALEGDETAEELSRTPARTPRPSAVRATEKTSS
ncbi:hypothetical protein DFH07DRAFT_775813 [Mycena maculata]|uniref:Uncharacterized protein n=1 Tax=Mycena maculata TaxID=230809 RepID=A0AAD7IQ90_9AGAR|nr:hypothetical protein DFH07DRAFT_775813 [Mycena maculata]